MRKITRHILLAVLFLSTQAHATETREMPLPRTMSHQMIGEIIDHRTNFEDTFIHLARDHNLGFVEMRAANPGIDPWVPGENKNLVLPTAHLLPNTPHEGVVINIPEMRIYAYTDKGKSPKTFPIGIGREGLETPKGETKIVRKTEGPSWRPTPRMRKEDPELEAVVPPGPNNPLGTHALYLGWPQYLIHGTNKPFGIGRRISSGCIRMYPEDVTVFFDLIPVGTKVTVIDQPVKMAWIDDELMIEAHPTEEQAMKVEETGAFSYDTVPEDDIKNIIKIAGAHYNQINWEAVRKIYGLRLGYPVPVAKKLDIQNADKDLKKDVKEEQPAQEKPFMDKLKNARNQLQKIYDFEMGKSEAEPKKHAKAQNAQKNKTLNP